MPIQTYRCPTHGDFAVAMSFTQEVPQFQTCPFLARDPAVWETMVASRSQVRRLYAQIGACGQASAWQPPTGVHFTIK